jgi:ComF family protein
LSIRTFTMRLWQDALDLVFPPRCLGCGRVDTTWCDRCHQRLNTLPLVFYQRTVQDVAVVASGEHSGTLQQAVQGLKYAQATALQGPLARRLGAALKHTRWSVDLVVPVPMHAARRQRRGYNQAALLAAALAAQQSLPFEPEAVVRHRETRTQVGLSRQERLVNVQDAFSADPSRVAGRTVLVVDDVCTTGATLAACAEAIQRSGALGIYGLTVTMARPI